MQNRWCPLQPAELPRLRTMSWEPVDLQSATYFTTYKQYTLWKNINADNTFISNMGKTTNGEKRERVGAGNTRQLIQSANQKGTSLCIWQWWKISEIRMASDDWTERVCRIIYCNSSLQIPYRVNCQGLWQ